MRSRPLLALLLLGGAAAAQPPEPAAVGRDRPLTTSWMCENERSVLLNFHPRRSSEEAWLTYAGTRVAVERTRSASGVSFGRACVAARHVGDIRGGTRAGSHTKP